MFFLVTIYFKFFFSFFFNFFFIVCNLQKYKHAKTKPDNRCKTQDIKVTTDKRSDR